MLRTDAGQLLTGLWSSGVGEGKAKNPVDKRLGPPFHVPAVHQILMQAPIGEDTDC